ncbi:MAG: glycosyl transferase family 2 [Oscillospiraceae bacterium]|nr:MAG: glycosyl transferase family 2 [Oscillospiraceae bacterium]
MKILVIIPCYNEAENIARVVKNLQAVAARQALPGTVDYLVVNDCSTDESAAICASEGFSYISLPVNLGIGGGVQSGYLYAAQNGYDIAVQMDGDGQHDPAYLASVVGPVARGEVDMCVGSRFITKEGFQTSAMRRAGIRLLSGLIRLLCGVRVLDVTSGFRATGRRLTEFFARNYAQDYPEPEAIISAVLNGFRVGEAPVVMAERMGGTSSISPLRSVYYMVKVSIALVVYRLTHPRRKGGRT